MCALFLPRARSSKITTRAGAGTGDRPRPRASAPARNPPVAGSCGRNPLTVPGRAADSAGQGPPGFAGGSPGVCGTCGRPGCRIRSRVTAADHGHGRAPFGGAGRRENRLVPCCCRLARGSGLDPRAGAASPPAARLWCSSRQEKLPCLRQDGVRLRGVTAVSAALPWISIHHVAAVAAGAPLAAPFTRRRTGRPRRGGRSRARPGRSRSPWSARSRSHPSRAPRRERRRAPR